MTALLVLPVLADSTVAAGSLVLALPIAFAAGLVSFLSPCVVPLVPGYLGYITGLAGEDLEGARKGRMVLGMVLFVLGFSFVFVVMGWTAGWLGSFLVAQAQTISRVMGIVTILLGLVYLGSFSFLQVDRKIDLRPAAGLGAAPLLGATFGLGWTACTGPTLAVIVNLGLVGGDPTRGLILALGYCLGLGLPFIAAGLAYRRAMGAFAVVRRHRVLVTRAGGAMLMLVGIALVTGWWDAWVQSLQTWVGGFETWL